MKKYIFAASIAVNLILIVTFLHRFSNENSEKRVGLDVKKNKTFNIAVLTPDSHPSLEQIQEAFKKTLLEIGFCKYRFKEFNANGNRVLMRSQAEEIVNGSFDLVFTVAAAPSLVVKEVMQKKGKHIPIVFGAVSDPVKLGLVNSLGLPGGFVTGSTETTAYEEQIRMLSNFKPEIKTVVLIYNPSQGRGLEKDKIELEKIFSDKNIRLVPVEVYSVGEIYGKLSAFINDADLVFILKDNTVVSGIDAVIKLCNQHHVTLMSTDLDSGKKGAALSFGVYESAFGVQSALLAIKILENGMNPGKLSCQTLSEHKLRINSNSLVNQNLKISTDLINLIKKTEVI